MTTQTLHLAMGRFDSPSYGEQEAVDTLIAWGMEPECQRHTNNVQGIALAGAGLFGIKQGTILTISTKEVLEQILIKLLKNTSIEESWKITAMNDTDRNTIMKNARNLAGNGMFILLTVNMQFKASKALVSLFKTMKWTYEEPSKDVGGEIDRILQDTFLPLDLRDMLIYHVGDQYDQLLPIVKGLSALSKEEQQALTWEDLWIRINPTPGAIPPWGNKGGEGLFDYVIKGDTTNALVFYNRLIESGTPVITFAEWLAKQIGQYAMMKFFVDYANIQINEAAHMVGLSSPAFKNNTDPMTGKRDGWSVSKKYQKIKNRNISPMTLKSMVQLTANDLTMIKKRGKLTVTDPLGNPVLDENGESITQYIDKPFTEELDDNAVGLRMVLRASEGFAGKLNIE